jgi:hypothetical protein
LIIFVIGHYIITQAEKPEKEKRKQKFKEFEENYYKEHNENESDVYLFDSCKDCVFFDGYDICCHEENFGSVTSARKTYCNKNKLFKYSELKP